MLGWVISFPFRSSISDLMKEQHGNTGARRGQGVLSPSKEPWRSKIGWTKSILLPWTAQKELSPHTQHTHTKEDLGNLHLCRWQAVKQWPAPRPGQQRGRLSRRWEPHPYPVVTKDTSITGDHRGAVVPLTSQQQRHQQRTNRELCSHPAYLFSSQYQQRQGGMLQLPVADSL